MNDTPTTGLRDLPLSQYLLRGKRSNAAAQYEELRQLQEEQTALTPMSCGPFRLFMFEGQEAMLRSVGKDRKGMVTSITQGIDVMRVEPAEGGIGGNVVGFIDKGQLRIVIGHEPEPPALADWKLLSVEGGQPRGLPLARLTAMWTVYKKQELDVVAGNAADTLGRFIGAGGDYQAWVRSWQPPSVSAPTMVVRRSSRLPRDATTDALLDSLLRSATPAYFFTRYPSRAGAGRKDTLHLIVPACNVQIELHRRLLADSAPNEWVLVNVSDRPTDSILLARLDAAWCPPDQLGRGASMSPPSDDAWLGQADEWEARYSHWREVGWETRGIAGGFFRLRVSGNCQADLQQRRITLEEICAAMNRGLDIYEVAGRESDVVVAVPHGLECRVRLTPYKPSVGNSDWKLIDLSSCFAQIAKPQAMPNG